MNFKFILIIFSSYFFYYFAFSQGVIDNFALEDPGGKLIPISELAGENFTVIEFWTTWCLPCHEMMKVMVKMYPEIKESGGEIIGINADGPRNIAKIRPFTRAMGVTYPILLDTRMEVMEELGVSVFPTLIILNRKGEIVYAKEGYSKKDRDILKSEIAKLQVEQN